MLNEISCSSSSLLVKYALTKGVAKSALFSGIEQYEAVLQNPLEWVDFETWDRLAANFCAARSDTQDALFQAGYEIPLRLVSTFQQFFFRVAPIHLIKQKIKQHFEHSINKNLVAEIEVVGEGAIELTIRPKARERYSERICDFNRGFAYALLIAKGYRNCRIKETCCAARSAAPACVYLGTWDPRPGIMQHLYNFFSFSFRDQRAIISHMEENQAKLRSQHEEILSMRDFYSHIMASMTESVLWLGRNGIIEFANRAFHALSGLPEDKLVGAYFMDLLAADTRARETFVRLHEECLTHPLKPAVAELSIKTRHGGHRIGIVSMIWVKSDHRAPGFLVTVRDVTEEKKIERELFLAQDRYRALYENSPAIIVGLGTDGRIIYVNPSMAEQTGYTSEELTGMHFSQLVAPNAEADVEGVFQELLHQPARLQELHFKTKAGEWKSIAFNTYQIFDDQKNLAGLAGIGIDVTETKRLNEQIIKTQRMELLGQMAGGLAHDFNNILTSITGYAVLIRRRSAEQKIREYADIVVQAGGRASELLKSLLAFSRGDVAKREEFDAVAIVREVRDMMRGVVPKNIKVLDRVPDDHCMLIGDPGKINQCVMNLCMNAKDAIGAKDGVITIRVSKPPQKEGFLWIQVEDNGTGIPPDIISRIFDPFFSTKAKKEGTGLGLSVVYGIVKAHKGDVYVDSRPGEGATFTLELPLSSRNQSARKKTVMVLDDDGLLRNYCTEILRDAGYDAEAFETMAEAAEWLTEHREETVFIVSDVVMPDMDVARFVDTVARLKPGLKIIWMSGHTTAEVQTVIREFPFLQKPFQPAALIEMVRTLGA
ncbi:MAG TPA: PAS domain S-box protein [Chitinivibrionales bacterium]|nr:PAS domain S-box protein [Chitinivibrionales bacterium]